MTQPLRRWLLDDVLLGGLLLVAASVAWVRVFPASLTLAAVVGAALLVPLLVCASGHLWSAGRWGWVARVTFSLVWLFALASVIAALFDLAPVFEPPRG